MNMTINGDDQGPQAGFPAGNLYAWLFYNCHIIIAL